MDSILTSIKAALGVTDEYDVFDQIIIRHINSVFMILRQLGVGPSEGFVVKNKNAQWTDFIQDEEKLELVKSYMGLRVELLFDPPSNSTLIDCKNRLIDEFEWRLNAEAESKREEEIQNG